MERVQIKIFVHKDVSRLNFILNVIFSNILGLGFDVVTNKCKLGETPAINYSDEHGRFKAEDSLLIKMDFYKNL